MMYKGRFFVAYHSHQFTLIIQKFQAWPLLYYLPHLKSVAFCVSPIQTLPSAHFSYIHATIIINEPHNLRPCRHNLMCENVAMNSYSNNFYLKRSNAYLYKYVHYLIIYSGMFPFLISLYWTMFTILSMSSIELFFIEFSKWKILLQENEGWHIGATLENVQSVVTCESGSVAAVIFLWEQALPFFQQPTFIKCRNRG